MSNVEEAKSACNKLRQLGCSSVIITLGHLGCVVAEQGSSDIVHVPAPVVEAVDTTVCRKCTVFSCSLKDCDENVFVAVQWKNKVFT